MENLKPEAIRVISALSESGNLEEIMYELYVVDKVKKGKEAVERGESQSTEELKKEMHSWLIGQNLQKTIVKFSPNKFRRLKVEQTKQPWLRQKKIVLTDLASLPEAFNR